jgi:4-hydroxybenzoate polyprenyltransferase
MGPMLAPAPHMGHLRILPPDRLPAIIACMLKSLLKTMRPRQWVKNVFVFAALAFDRQLLEPVPLLRTLAGFGLLCLASSAVYLINDLADLEYDRRHPVKRHRPLAAGKLPVSAAIIAAVVLLLLSIPAGFMLGIAFGIILSVYIAFNLLYSFWLKHTPIIDVMVVASGYLLRVSGGVVLITVQRFSPWLYMCTALLALFIVVGKRRAELVLSTNAENTSRKVLDGYTLAFLDQLIVILSSTTIIAYSLYTFFAENVRQNSIMMLSIPFVIYGIFRYLQLIHVENAGGAPEELVLSDRPLMATILLWGLFSLGVLYLSP